MAYWGFPASEVLDNAYVMELYDVRALETRAEVTKSLFDTYTRMAYTRDEREQLYGIGLAIVTFVVQYPSEIDFQRTAQASVSQNL
ncbi:hypothetical protein [Serratia marcescens]|uniref:hypothetical protein n=1 Tax=Serratia marcescens TaxID=615 RepID=UPI0027E586E5|nr:hypothetical protein [Serratia marcescens]MDH2268877.1 hypothetical protein [Serratia marcescens]MDH2276854.1 hypothetical protein [Serratia marcescens]